MAHQIDFEKLIRYDIGKSGISLEVELRLDGDAIKVEAKVDTGSSFCIFARRYGESLGIAV